MYWIRIDLPLQKLPQFKMTESSQKIKIAAIGECMLEFHQISQSNWAMRYGGDTFNVAFYLNHYATNSRFEIQYITILGDDPHSEEMLSSWKSQGLGVDWVLRLPGGKPGLYLINTDEQGERSFVYYRTESAARQLFNVENTKQLAQVLLACDTLYLSGITLAILETEHRIRLQTLLRAAKSKGISIVFDTNFRPTLWESQAKAQQAVGEIFPFVDIALPTFEDHQILFDTPTPESCAQHLHEFGITEVIVKCGKSPCFVSQIQKEPFWIAAHKVHNVKDTSGAGDSFNAGYLWGRLNQRSLAQSAEMGHRLAATVVQHPGVILDPQVLPDLF